MAQLVKLVVSWGIGPSLPTSWYSLVTYSSSVIQRDRSHRLHVVAKGQLGGVVCWHLTFPHQLRVNLCIKPYNTCSRLGVDTAKSLVNRSYIELSAVSTLLFQFYLLYKA